MPITGEAADSIRFNSQPPEGGWYSFRYCVFSGKGFQLTAARRRLVVFTGIKKFPVMFQLTAARRRLGITAAGRHLHVRFNSQPPEGGWGLI